VLTCIGGVIFASLDDELLATLRATPMIPPAVDLEPIFVENP
jgi:hypothetical protein